MSKGTNSFLALIAIGDAFGMKYEFVEHKIPINKDELFYGPKPSFAEYQVGHYTDDAQRSLANTEALLRTPADKITRDDFVRAWLDVFKRDPRRGYSKYMFQILSDDLSPREFCEHVKTSPEADDSGGAMGAGVIGLLDDLETVKRVTIDQVMPTHNTTAGKFSALAVSLSVHFLHHGGKPQYLEAFLDQHLGNNWYSEQNGLTDAPENGLRVVRQALNAVNGASSLSQVLINAASQTEKADTDTICAIAMAICSRCKDVTNDLPAELIRGVENGYYGLAYLHKMDSVLLRRFPASQKYSDFTP